MRDSRLGWGSPAGCRRKSTGWNPRGTGCAGTLGWYLGRNVLFATYDPPTSNRQLHSRVVFPACPLAESRPCGRKRRTISATRSQEVHAPRLFWAQRSMMKSENVRERNSARKGKATWKLADSDVKNDAVGSPRRRLLVEENAAWKVYAP